MTTYFKNCRTAEELKKEYFRLAKIHHPDAGGDLEIMKAINNEYDATWTKLKNVHANKEGETFTSRQETQETAEMFKDIINELLRYKGLVIEICGAWLRISGETKAYKEQLGKAGCHWSPKKIMWYWRAEEYRAWHNRKTHDMNYIRVKYGSEIINRRESKDPDQISA